MGITIVLAWTSRSIRALTATRSAERVSNVVVERLRCVRIIDSMRNSPLYKPSRTVAMVESEKRIEKVIGRDERGVGCEGIKV